jgi:NAD-dependent SIR2 family protein deacetylase
MHAKVKAMARLIGKANRCVIFSGAGLSTAAGIGDYASSAVDSASGAPNPLTGAQPASPLCAQPTLAHRVLVAMHSAKPFHRWINQNHDGLPQKAGFPQEDMNEIHGAWHAPDNPVIVMSGNLREDLFADLLECEKQADLAIAVGTSVCGMNADRVVTTPAARAASKQPGQLGSVLIGLQQTVHDDEATLRIFARCDDVFAMLAQELALEVAPALPKGEYFTPTILKGLAENGYLFKGIPYNVAGEYSAGASMSWDIQEDAQLVIPRGLHAGAQGEVVGFDREGNLRCRFKLKPKKGNLRAWVPMLLGRWWIQAAVNGSVPMLPVVNVPPEENVADADNPALSGLRELIRSYAAP